MSIVRIGEAAAGFAAAGPKGAVVARWVEVCTVGLAKNGAG
jgi:hypothetical protein